MGAYDKIDKFLEKSKSVRDLSVPARARINALLDEGSFMETGAFVSQRPTEFEGATATAPAEAVVTGWGTIDGAPVYVFSQDVTALGGALSEMHAKKITALYTLALKTGNPVVGIFDSKGARITEGVDALNGYAEVISAVSSASGIIPQIAVVCGICGGATALAAQAFDFVVMSDKAEIFMHTPTVVNASEHSDTELGSAAVCAKNGLAAFTASDDMQAIECARSLVCYIPSNNAGDINFSDTSDDINRICDLKTLISDDLSEQVSPDALLSQIADNGVYTELFAEWATSATVGFARFDGESVGIVASRGEIDAYGAKKAARFVSFCDCFNIPVLTIVDAGGFAVSSAFELGDGIKAAASLAGAYASATVPKVTLITRKAIGSAYIALCSKGLGADIVISWPTAEIGAVADEAAAVMMFGSQIAAAADPVAERAKSAEIYRETIASPFEAAKRGYVDEIINPAETRKSIVYSLGLMSTKRVGQPQRKHINRAL